MKPPVKPDNIPSPPEGFTYAGKGALVGTIGELSKDVARYIESTGWDIPNVGNRNWIYAVRTDSPIHKAQPWYVNESFEIMKDLMQLNPKLNRLAFFDAEELETELERRRKPKTITINGIEVPEPYRGEMKAGQPYYTPELYECGDDYRELYFALQWRDTLYDNAAMKKGLVHLTKEAAIKHAEALISFTKQP
jgi:hypothetical protein